MGLPLDKGCGALDRFNLALPESGCHHILPGVASNGEPDKYWVGNCRHQMKVCPDVCWFETCWLLSGWLPNHKKTCTEMAWGLGCHSYRFTQGIKSEEQAVYGLCHFFLVLVLWQWMFPGTSWLVCLFFHECSYGHIRVWTLLKYR